MPVSKSNSFSQEEIFNVSLPKELYNYFNPIAKINDKTVNEFIQELLCKLLPDSLEDVIGKDRYKKVLDKVISNEQYLTSSSKFITSGEHLAKYIFSEPYNAEERDNFVCTVNFKDTFLRQLNNDLEVALSKFTNNDCRFPNKLYLFIIKNNKYKNKLAFKFNNKFYFDNQSHDSETIEVITRLNTKVFLNKVFNGNEEYVNFSSLLDILCLYIDTVCNTLSEYVKHTSTEIIANLDQCYLFNNLRFIRSSDTKIPFINKGDCKLKELSVNEVKSVIRKCLNYYVSEVYIFIYNAYPLDSDLLNKLINPFKEIMKVLDALGTKKNLFNFHERLIDNKFYLETYVDFRTEDTVIKLPKNWYSTYECKYFNLNNLSNVEFSESFVKIGYVSGETFLKKIFEKYSTTSAKVIDELVVNCIVNTTNKMILLNKAKDSDYDSLINLLKLFIVCIDPNKDIPSDIHSYFESFVCNLIKKIRNIRKSILKSERADIKEYLIWITDCTKLIMYNVDTFNKLTKDNILGITYNEYMRK